MSINWFKKPNLCQSELKKLQQIILKKNPTMF